MFETSKGGYVAHGDYATLFSELEVVKAERDALERQLSMSEAKCKGYFSDAAAALIKCDALAVENAGFKHALSVILEHVDVTEKGQAGVVAMIANDELFNSETPATDAALAAIEARVWTEAKDLAKSMLATDSADHIDFLFDGKIKQLREGK